MLLLLAALVAPPPLSAQTPAPAPAPQPSRRPPPIARDSTPSAAGGIQPTVDALRDGWPDIVSEVRGKTRFLGEALAATTPVAVEAPWLTVELAEANPLFAEQLQGQASAVEEVLARVTGRPLRLRVTQRPADPSSEPPRPQRLSEASVKADRLRSFRAKDPTLDTAADALDLEIVD
jgi:hypothetical protein